MLRGMNESQGRTRDGWARARYCFNSAVELDPNYANGFARLSLNAIYEWIAGWSETAEDTIGRGAELAKKSVALDNNNPVANAALCWALLWTGEHDAAIKAGRKAIKLDPNNVAALERLAFAFAYAWSDRADEALPLIAKAQILNPLHGYYFPTGVCYFMLERYSAAIPSLRNSIDAFPTFLPSYLYLAACLSLLDQPEDARPLVKSIRDLDPDYRTVDTVRSTFKFEKDQARFADAISRVLKTS